MCVSAHPVLDTASSLGSLAPPLEASEASIFLAVETFKLLGDVTRLKILWALMHSEHSVAELADHIGAHSPAVSQHLAKLRAARLVRVRRDGNRLFYAADDAHVRHLVEQALFHSGRVIPDLPLGRSDAPALPEVRREGRGQ
jgi:DNA-binding transcriptional ArsR family regulator